MLVRFQCDRARFELAAHGVVCDATITVRTGNVGLIFQAAAPEKIQPFDKNKWFGLADGAAFCLESERYAVHRGATALAEIVGYGVSTDTYHLTQPHPSGIGRNLQCSSSEVAGLAAGSITM